MKILIVEDDHLQVDLIRARLQSAITHLGVRVVSTESEFRARLSEIEADTPDVIVMDVMLRWADPEPELKRPPKDIHDEGYYRAGLRCQRLLAERERTRNVPVILYTVLDRNDLAETIASLPSNVIHIGKWTPESLVTEIRRLTRR